ncbi:MAG: NUDIX hydrolase [Pseudomonadota bacterium]
MSPGIAGDMSEFEQKQPNRPLVSVGAVVFRDQDVLLIKRGRPPLLGQWSIPGGKVGFGESLEAAVKREVLEETGLAIKIGELINVFEALPEAAEDKHYVMVDFVAEWLDGEPVAADDAADAAFFPLDEALEKLKWDKTRDALRQAIGLRSST